MGDDPRLPKMPEKPTLLDFFQVPREGHPIHLLQSATHALNAGMPEPTILACLLHDIANSDLHPRAITAIGARSSSSPMSAKR